MGQHPDYPVAMVKHVDDVTIAIYVSKEPSPFASPIILETMLSPCGEKKPIAMHASQAIIALGTSVEERRQEVREVLDAVFERGRASCKLAADLEERFFRKFEETYAATDAILVEAGIFPLSDPFQPSADQGQ